MDIWSFPFHVIYSWNKNWEIESETVKIVYQTSGSKLNVHHSSLTKVTDFFNERDQYFIHLLLCRCCIFPPKTFPISEGIALSAPSSLHPHHSWPYPTQPYLDIFLDHSFVTSKRSVSLLFCFSERYVNLKKSCSFLRFG